MIVYSAIDGDLIAWVFMEFLWEDTVPKWIWFNPNASNNNRTYKIQIDSLLNLWIGLIGEGNQIYDSVSRREKWEVSWRILR